MKVFALLFVIFSTSVLAEWNPKVGLEWRNFKDDEKKNTDETSMAIDLTLIGEQQFAKALLKSDIVQRIDLVQSERNLLIVKEFYLVAEDDSQFKFGWQIFNHSVLEYFHPAQQLNAANMDGSVESFEKIGEFALSYGFILGDSTLNFHYLPLYKENAYPAKNVRTGFGSEVTDGSYIENGQAVDDALTSQFAFDFSTVFDNLDWGVQGGRIISKDTVSFAYNSAISGQESVRPIQYWKNFVATTFSYAWEDLLLKAEVVYSDFDREQVTLPYTVFMGTVITLNNTYQSPRDYTIYAFGLERMYQIFDGVEMTLFSEYQKIEGVDAGSASSYQIFQNDLTLGLRLAFNDIDDSSFQAFWVKDVSGADEGLFFTKFGQRLGSQLRYNIGLVVVDSKESKSNVNSLAPVKDIDYGYFNLVYYF